MHGKHKCKAPSAKESKYIFLTPAKDAELSNVGGHIDIEDLDQGKVHVDGLQAHPSEGGQQEVVERGSSRDAQSVAVEGRQPGVEQEHQVQSKQGQGQVDQDFRGVVSAQLPVRETYRIIGVKRSDNSRQGRVKHKKGNILERN